MDENELTLSQIAQVRKMQELGMQPEYGSSDIERPEEKFLEQLNPRFLCLEFENNLRGKQYNAETEKWEDISGLDKNEGINEKGIAEIMKVVRSKVNTNTVYSNLPEEIIDNITIDSGVRISRLLSLKYKTYNMQVIDINTITNDACDFIYTALRRGNDALTLRLLRTMIQTKELTTNQGSDKKKMSLNPLNLLRRDR